MADNPELLELAAQLERDADECQALTDPIKGATGPEVLAGGRLSDSVDELIALSENQVRALAADLEAVATQLRRIEVVDLPVETGTELSISALGGAI